MSSGSEDEEKAEEEDDLSHQEVRRKRKRTKRKRKRKTTYHHEEGEPPPMEKKPADPESVESGPRERPEEEEIPDPITFRGRQHPGWRSVGQGIEQRHQGRHQAFRIRKREVNQETYVEPRASSPITPTWSLPEKGTEEWIGLREETGKRKLRGCWNGFLARRNGASSMKGGKCD
jgi:hypothetical protein